MARWLAACALVTAAISCTYDYGVFEIASDPVASASSASSASTGVGGVGASTGGVGGLGGAGGQGGAGGVGGVGGVGGAGGCGPGTKACGTDCVSVDDPSFGCASSACGACDLANATAICAGGACAIGGCAAGFTDCDTLPDNGCEADLATSPGHCGACGRACSTAGVASLACAGGLCVSACEMGFANCVAPASPAPDDGCEANVSQDDLACGGCGNTCTLQGNVGEGQPFVCDGGARPKSHCGCWTNKSCRVGGAGGQCNAATGRCSCAGLACREGEACIPAGANEVCSCNGAAACAAGQACCQTPAGCVDVLTDPQSCGACGRACPAGFACALGACACTTDAQCDAGSPGTIACLGGQCSCFGVPCAEGERCQPDGSCG